MNDGQDKATDKATENTNLKLEQKERLRAAIQILIDYLLEDGQLTQYSPVSQKTRKSDPAKTGTASTLSETDSL